MAETFVKIDADYSQIPWYRKRWFLALTILFFAPATILIAATGDIYAARKDGVYMYSSTGKWTVIGVAVAFIVLGLSRLVAS